MFSHLRLSFKLFSYEGNRIIYPSDNLREFGYSDREMCSDVFIFENSNQHEAYVLGIMKGDNIDDSDVSNFTLDILSFIEIDIKEIPEPEFLDSTSLIGKFESDSPAGPIQSRYFANCPQYKLDLPSRCRIQLKAQSSEENSLMIIIFDGGQEITQTSVSSIASNKNPGSFTPGFSCLELNLIEGSYTIILVTEKESVPSEYEILVS